MNPPTAPSLADSPTAAGAARTGAVWSLLLLLSINLFNYIDRYVLAAVVPRIQEEFKCDDAQAGLLATVFLISYMLFAPLFGWLAGKHSRWMLVGVGVILWSLASGASGLAGSIGVMLLTRAFVGIGEAAYGPTAPTIIADLYPIERRGRVLAWFYAAIPVGSALGYLLGGHVLDMGFSWHKAFFVVVPPGIVLGLLCLLMRDPRHSHAPSHTDTALQPKRRISLANYKRLLRIPSFLFNTIGMTAMTFALGGIAFWMPKYIVWHTGGRIDLEGANKAFGPIVVVSGLVATLGGGWLGDRLRNRWPGSYFLVSGIGMLLVFPLFLLLPITPFPAAWALIFVACLGLFFNTGPTNTILANVTQPSMRAAGFALNIFIIHALGDVISPPLIGAINDHFDGNMNAGFIAVSFAILFSGLAWVWGARYLEHDTLRASDSCPPLPVGEV